MWFISDKNLNFKNPKWPPKHKFIKKLVVLSHMMQYNIYSECIIYRVNHFDKMQ